MSEKKLHDDKNGPKRELILAGVPKFPFNLPHLAVLHFPEYLCESNNLKALKHLNSQWEHTELKYM